MGSKPHFFFSGQKWSNRIESKDIAQDEKKNAKLNQKIYTPRESSDTPGGFGFEKAKRTHRRSLSRIIKAQEEK